MKIGPWVRIKNTRIGYPETDVQTRETLLVYRCDGQNREVNLHELIEFVEDVREHGLRTDMNPTVGGRLNANNVYDMYVQMCNYFKGAEIFLKSRSMRALRLIPVADGYREEER